MCIRDRTYDQLLKYIRCDHSLESELGLNPSDRSIEPALVEALEQTILPHVADPARNYLFNTLWTAIDKDAHQMVGDLCFVGEPNEAGEVEIGYGTYPAVSYTHLDVYKRQLYDHQGKSERIKNFPYPRQFATVSSMFVKLFCIMLPFSMLKDFDKLNENIGGIMQGQMVWLVIPFSMLISWVYTSRCV